MVARRSARLQRSHVHQETCFAPEASTHCSGNDARDPGQAEPSDTGLPEFEQQRLEKIRENAARLAELTSLAEGLAAPGGPPKPSTSIKGVKKTRVQKKPPVPPSLRRTRARGLDEQSQQYAAGLAPPKHGRVGLQIALGQYRTDSAKAGDPQGPGNAAPEVPIGVPQAAESVNCDSNETHHFLRCLNGVKTTSSLEADAHLPPQRHGVMALSLIEGNVAKVVKDAIVEMSFMPSAGDRQCIVAACDKRGQVGIWGSDPWDPDAASTYGEEGVLLMHPHEAYASALFWLDGNLLTASYDGTIRLLDVGAATWTVLRRDHVDGFSAMSVQGQHTLVLAYDAGHMSLADCRSAPTPGALKPMLLHDKRINTIHCTPDGGTSGHSFVTSSSDTSVKIWDSRMLRPVGKKGTMVKPVAELSHTKSCHGAYFDPASQRIVTTSYDNTVCVWHSKGGKWAQTTKWRHNNNTGRWILPFRARWGPDGETVICGDMTRGICVWPSAEQATAPQMLRSEFMTAIPSRLAVDSTNGVVAAATGSGRVHLWTPAPPVLTVKQTSSSANRACSIQ